MSFSDMTNSSAVNIALAKKAKIVTGSEMPPFFAAKLKANHDNPLTRSSPASAAA